MYRDTDRGACTCVREARCLVFQVAADQEEPCYLLTYFPTKLKVEIPAFAIFGVIGKVKALHVARFVTVVIVTCCSIELIIVDLVTDILYMYNRWAEYCAGVPCRTTSMTGFSRWEVWHTYGWSLVADCKSCKNNKTLY